MTSNTWGYYRTDVVNPVNLILGFPYKVVITSGTVTYNGQSVANNAVFNAVSGKLKNTDVVKTGTATHQLDSTQVAFVNNMMSFGDTLGDGTMLNPYKTINKAITASKRFIICAGGSYTETIAGSGIVNSTPGINIHFINRNILYQSAIVGDLTGVPRINLTNATLKSCTIKATQYTSDQIQGSGFDSCIIDNCTWNTESTSEKGSSELYKVYNTLFKSTSANLIRSTNATFFSVTPKIENSTFVGGTWNFGIYYSTAYQADTMTANVFDGCTINFLTVSNIKNSVFKGCTIKCGTRSAILYDGTAGKDLAKLQDEMYQAFSSQFLAGLPFLCFVGCVVESSTDNMFVDKTNGNYSIKSTHPAATINAGKYAGAYRVGNAIKPVAANTASTFEYDTTNGSPSNVTIANNSITLTSTASNGNVLSDIVDLGEVYTGIVISSIGTETIANGEALNESSDLGSSINSGSNVLTVNSFYQNDHATNPIFYENTSINIASGALVVGASFVVRGGTPASNYITYPVSGGSNYSEGMVFTAIAGQLNYTETGVCDVYRITEIPAKNCWKATVTNYYNYIGNSATVRELLKIANTRTFTAAYSATDPTLTGASFLEFFYDKPMSVDSSNRSNADPNFDPSSESFIIVRYIQHKASITVNNRIQWPA